MRTFVFRLVQFVVVVLLAYPLGVCLWGMAMPDYFKPNLNYRLGANGHLYSRIQEVTALEKPVDVLVLGSSHAYRGFDPRIFTEHGYHMFNLGSSAQTPLQTEVLVRRYFDKLLPKYVLFEVYPAMFSADGVESAVDLVANAPNDWSSVEMAWNVQNLKVYNTLIFGLFAEATGLYADYIEPVHKGVDTYVEGGFVEREIAYNSPAELSATVGEPLPKQLAAFRQTVRYLAAHDVQLVFVYTPVTSARYLIDGKCAALESVLAEPFPFYDFNTMLTLDDSLHFYDGDHLNQSGVRLFNEQLLNKLFE